MTWLRFALFCMLWGQSYALDVTVECDKKNIQKDAQAFFSKHISQENLKQSISQSIKRFYYRWDIRHIKANVKDGTHVVINITPELLISSVKVKGNQLVKKKNIIKQIEVFRNIYDGGSFEKDLSLYLEGYYATRGFFKSSIQSSLSQHKRKLNPRLMIQIQENAPCVLDRFQVGGDPFFDVSVFSKKLRKKIKNRCDQEALLDFKEKYEEKYQQKNYKRFEILFEPFEKKQKNKKADLGIEVEMGIKTQIHFYGNTFAFERDELLKKAIFFDQEKKFNDTWVESTAKESIEMFYHSKGYPFAKVSARRDVDAKKNTQIISFVIDRGALIRIGSINFKGNQYYASKKLEHEFFFYAPKHTRRKVFVEDEIEIILDRLLSFYQSNGFLRATLKEFTFEIDPKIHAANIFIEFEEGIRSTLKSLKVDGNTFFSDKKIRRILSIKKGAPVNLLELNQGVKHLERRYREKGFKYVKVMVPSISSIESESADLVLRIDEGRRVLVGDVLLKGNHVTQPKVIRREIRFKSNKIYNVLDIERTKANLIRLGFFQSVVIIEQPRPDQEGIEDLIVVVRERDQRLLVVKPGLSTDDGYRLSASLGYTNIAGTGRSATLSGRMNRQIRQTNASNILEHRLVMTYFEPNIFNVVDGKLSLISERTDETLFDISRSSLIVGVEKIWERYLKTTLQWELESRSPFNVEPGAVLSPIDQDQARFGSIAAIVDVDFRDNVLNAERGMYHRVQFDFFDQNLLSDAEFYRLSATHSFYMPLYRRVRSIFSLRLGFADTLGKTSQSGIDQIPLEKRFRLGGNDNLRGFSRNCVGGLGSIVPENCSSSIFSQAPGGNSMFNYLLEFLFPINDTFDFVLFTDGGNAYLKNQDFGFFDIRNTAGLGFRFNTFVGPLRIDYGIKLDRRVGESFGELHFAVGQF